MFSDQLLANLDRKSSGLQLQINCKIRVQVAKNHSERQKKSFCLKIAQHYRAPNINEKVF
jgi:hypothetical protein